VGGAIDSAGTLQGAGDGGSYICGLGVTDEDYGRSNATDYGRLDHNAASGYGVERVEPQKWDQ